MTSRQLANLYQRAHDVMRNIDGLQPQEAFDELLKCLFLFQEGIPAARDAKALRAGYRKQAAAAPAAGHNHWVDREIRLSDKALTRIRELFADVDLAALDVDFRSAALRGFLAPELRRGLGIYLTPDIVVQAAVKLVSPPLKAAVCDPACGSGTFLIETVKFWRTKRKSAVHRVIGLDKSARMLRIAELNLSHHADVEFVGVCQDALTPVARWAGRLRPNSIDVVFTNPPFGVVVESEAEGSTSSLVFEAMAGAGKPRPRVPSELLFIEQCLRLLRPGGTLAIVVPRSVVSNSTFARVRRQIGELGYAYAALMLPPETFAVAGAQTTTCVLFMRKYKDREDPRSPVRVAVATSRNVGYDSTGRDTPDPDTLAVSEALASAVKSGRPAGATTFTDLTAKSESLEALSNLRLSSHSSSRSAMPPDLTRLRQGCGGPPERYARRRKVGPAAALRDICANIATGRTPARSDYADDGLFVVKVGNLTGSGIDWTPRDRNFVPQKGAAKRAAAGLLLEKGDILLTSSAHAQRYIAKKVDVVDLVPAEVGGVASFVGEVLRIRVAPDALDPLALLAYLRMDGTVAELQQMVRGQTAHLMPGDVGTLALPQWLFEPNERLKALTDLIAEELRTFQALQVVQRKQRLLLQGLGQSTEGSAGGLLGTPRAPAPPANPRSARTRGMALSTARVRN